MGVKRIRRVGHSLEFEQIRPYVPGDDPRSINWKASARRATGGPDALVVNHFQDERAQQVYCLIDKGRVMRMPFEGLSLLDYAINATLVVSNIALLKHDKAGLVTFSNRPGAIVPADRRGGHLLKLLEVLYRRTPSTSKPTSSCCTPTSRPALGSVACCCCSPISKP